jgi:hypothetical protein
MLAWALAAVVTGMGAAAVAAAGSGPGPMGVSGSTGFAGQGWWNQDDDEVLLLVVFAGEGDAASAGAAWRTEDRIWRRTESRCSWRE